ncbi:hypothetical protein AAFF_G00214710 [Aldrovandia affinis]|uniref:Uncharacterized protein n=1 Tax=Aldrovandia affinis TaxID=143900 RepID=A0AAD7RGJ9_9TELE|nr:hypothetical protein AAFF_G00214710 [Aldrovandia affinis]
MDSGSLLMSEIVDIPDDSSPSEDSCLLEVGVGVRGRGSGCGSEGGEYVSFRCPSQSQPPPDAPSICPQSRHCFRGERSNSCSSPSSSASHRSPVLRHQAILASSCSQLELLGGAGSQRSSIPQIRVRPCTPSRHGSDTSAASSVTNHGNGPPILLLPPYPHRRGVGQRRDSDSYLPLVRSHSEPGLSSSTDTGDFSGSMGSKGVSDEGSQTSSETGPTSEACLLPRSSLAPPSALPRKGSVKAGIGLLPSKPPPVSPLRLPKDCARSLGDLKVTRVLVARFLQRSKRNLAPSSDHAGGSGQGPKRTGQGNGTGHRPFEQVLRNSWGASRGQQYQQHSHHRSHHSQSESHSPRQYNPVQMEGIHLRSCGDLSSTSAASLRRLLSRPHGSSGTLYSESAL